jgi:hypothetical protein
MTLPEEVSVPRFALTGGNMLLLDVGRRRWRIYLIQIVFLVFIGPWLAMAITGTGPFVQSTAWERIAASVAILAVGSALILGIRLYGTRYVTRLERQGADLHISTFGLFTRERTLNVRVADVAVGGRHEGYMSTGRQTVYTPWRALRLPGYRIPFILDLQAPVLDERAIAALGGCATDEGVKPPRD